MNFDQDLANSQKSHAIPHRNGGELRKKNIIPKVTYSLLKDSLVSGLYLKDFIFF